jgi:hypothetical protein
LPPGLRCVILSFTSSKSDGIAFTKFNPVTNSKYAKSASPGGRRYHITRSLLKPFAGYLTKSNTSAIQLGKLPDNRLRAGGSVR